MKTKALSTLALCALFASCGEASKTDAQDDHTTPAAKADSGFTVEQLAERAIHRRAVEAVIWGMPAVNFELMYNALVAAKGEWNQVVYWSRLPDWKNQTLTPNPDVIYLMPFYNTKDGPVVLEIPPAEEGSITGSVDDAWQTAIEDVGPAGVDKGKGGKYLITPPGYTGKVPAGYIHMPSTTVAGYALLRSNLNGTSDAEVAKAAEYGRRVKIHPLSQAGAPSATTFVDAMDLVFDATIPYDLRFFQLLDGFVQREPWMLRDKSMIDQLRTIGIEKGKPFAPDAKAKDILSAAIREAKAVMEQGYEDVFDPPFNEGKHWALPASVEVAEGMQTMFANPDQYPVDGRGMTYSLVFFSAKHVAAGQYYLMTIVDKDGKPFDGASNYRLSVPANPPMRLYWSLTVYDRATHALIRDLSRASRASNSAGLQQNSDGTTDIYFGPKAPEGKESNWIPTKPDGKFEVLFRIYGPEKPFFEKAWVLPDVEKVN